MFRFFFLLQIAIVLDVVAQDSSYCFNSGSISSPAVEVLTESKLTPALPLILMPSVVNNKTILEFLSKNTIVEKHIKKMRLSNKIKIISFSVLPACAVGAIGFAATNKTSLGIGFFAASVISFSSGLYFNKEGGHNFKKAVAEYNRLIN